ncbi:potassium/proton antiporter [Kineococcus rhizosphaerae]|uniref:Potassium/proton antiporter (CPA1 family) n=1 Tax=Kineococcus rhizosphaerae TaxID=559628 RepID=A0A2T0R110_9ACTN|nr:potassium/proton antiporter [Kineococcus rhizosphaerae]PRY12969.1 potassium/proton antiporter (CPA1 family) [Kineococcus rhizosphaerae]
MTLEDFSRVLLLASGVLLLAVLAVRLSTRTGLPSLLLYLALGLVLGEDGLGIPFTDAEIAQVLGYGALVLILAEGGLTTRWDAIRGVLAPAGALATVGTAVSIGVVGAGAHLLLHTSWPVSFLVGAVVSSTDAAAVFSVLRSVPLPRRLSGILEAESGLNDAPVVIAVLALTEVAAGHSDHAWWFFLGEAVFELALGTAVGVGVGAAGAFLLRRTALPSAGLYPVAVLALAVGAFAVADVLHASGFLATYLCGLVLGNARLPHRQATRGFAEAFGWLAQIGLFVMLGLLADPSRLPAALLGALLVGVVLTLFARPVSVLAALAWFRLPRPELLFLSWAGLRGAVPVVLATVPVVAGISGSEQLFDLVVVLVVVFTLVQAPTLAPLARRLGLISAAPTQELDVEVSPLGTLSADVVQVRVGPTSRLHGVEVFELRLPKGANVSLVAREGTTFVPQPRTVLRRGDDLLVVTSTAERRRVEERLQAISRDGKLAGWRDT